MRISVDEIIETIANEAIISIDSVVKLKLQQACAAIDGMEADINDIVRRGACVCCTESKDSCADAEVCKGFRYLGPDVG